LFQHDLLPDVMSGASMGAMIGAGICVRTDAELHEMVEDVSSIRRYALELAPVRQMWAQRGVLDPQVMIETIRKNCGDWTFAEAFERTGRVLNISVSPTRRGQKPRLLCHTTAPDVLISDAALASSSIPGVYPPAKLFRRVPDGGRVPYVGSERWIDGSMHGDLPKRRMSRLHNVNHFVVSQTNPHVVPFLKDKRLRSRWGAAVGLSGRVLRYQSAGMLNAVELMAANTPFRPWATTVRSLVGQDYLGDIDIHPDFRPGLLLKAFTNPTEQELRGYILAGERATWAHLARISVKTRLARCLASAIRRSTPSSR
jgi:NTE family protein